MICNTSFKQTTKTQSIAPSSVARGGAGGYSPPPHWPVNQNVESEKCHVFSSFETAFFCAGIDEKGFKAFFETYIQGGLLCPNLKSQINENFPKNKQSNLIASVKTPNISFINK